MEKSVTSEKKAIIQLNFTCKSHSIHDEGQDEEVVVAADVDDLVALEEEGHGGHDANGDGEPYEQLGGAQRLQVDVKESLEVVPKGPKSGHDHKQGDEFLLVDEVAHAPPLQGEQSSKVISNAEDTAKGLCQTM